MLNNDYQKTILELWVLVDKVIFGNKNPKDVLVRESDFNAYRTNKGALINNVVEMYSKYNFVPSTEYKTTSELLDSVNKRVQESFEYVDEIMQENKAELAKEVFEIGKSPSIVKRFVFEKRNKSVLDSLLLKEFSNHAQDVDRILKESYRILRDSLVKEVLDVSTKE